MKHHCWSTALSLLPLPPPPISPPSHFFLKKEGLLCFGHLKFTQESCLTGRRYKVEVMLSLGGGWEWWAFCSFELVLFVQNSLYWVADLFLRLLTTSGWVVSQQVWWEKLLLQHYPQGWMVDAHWYQSCVSPMSRKCPVFYVLGKKKFGHWKTGRQISNSDNKIFWWTSFLYAVWYCQVLLNLW